ncbi:MAG: hypothetical protein XD91_1284 [Clostridiales bacterium 38_11]|nr:MAG: hypothetical protein XD91_1284 [Clostridiales bacterium 38_11]
MEMFVTDLAKEYIKSRTENVTIDLIEQISLSG